MATPATAEREFDDFYARNFAGIGTQIAAYLGDRTEAEDVTQEAFAQAWRRWSRVSGYADPVAWVRTVAYRLAVSRWRRLRVAFAHRRQQRAEPVPPPDAAWLDLVAALATLPPTQRRAIVLHYLGDLSVDEIADREGVPAGTVKSWLHRARGRLATSLGPGETDRTDPERVLREH
ncbi:RNA polymerase sigma factor [Cryptosporangium aurantiacum]|uniref:RNA polymerase sigma-70 factor, ECF subfamily n=1 Tax=Cryptosporangium aurantiacum TaxID=134849 RepID=A0A1M7HKJ3_9ACTN|nr:SigE family RNA polymerase sigma factor [Cryptosporangium aurantiacum]SHM28970.1 RNA polymerase sigma-70 factor, ECF subfamily [Cryptosporangium aurantiacum]